jgi:glycosyltransferase involved in cell wall biosynthesis
MPKTYTIFVNHPSQYMTDCEPHGDGLLAYQYIDRLARRGHQVYVAAPIVKLREPVHSNVHLFLIKTITKPSWEQPSRLHRIEYALRVRRLYKRLQVDVRFDLLHQLNPLVTWVNLFLPARQLPWVVGPVPPSWPASENATGCSVSGRLRSIWKRLIDWEMFRRASCILIPVPSGREAVPDCAGIRSRIRPLNYGIDTEQFAPVQTAFAAQHDLHVLFLANLHERKGVYIMLQAFQTVIEHVPEARLTIAGDGPERERLERMVGEMSLSNQICMLGAIARDKVRSLMHSCTVYCLPSYGEPFGMTALEAMACGKPVVVTAAGGLDSLVDDRGGVKVPVGDSEKLAEGLITLLRNPALCRQMGNHNREVAVSKYDWVVVLDELERIYEQTITGR